MVGASERLFCGVWKVLIFEKSKKIKRQCGEAWNLSGEDSMGSGRTGDVLFGTGAAVKHCGS